MQTYTDKLSMALVVALLALAVTLSLRNAGGDDSTFITQPDTPPTYSGHAGECVVVGLAEDDTTFEPCAGAGQADGVVNHVNLGVTSGVLTTTLGFSNRSNLSASATLPTGGTGLAFVHRENSLTGDGTSGDPLAVADPQHIDVTARADIVTGSSNLNTHEADNAAHNITDVRSEIAQHEADNAAHNIPDIRSEIAQHISSTAETILYEATTDHRQRPPP